MPSSAYCALRLRTNPESHRGSDLDVSGDHYEALVNLVMQVALSARKIANGAQQILVRGVGVDRRGHDGLVAGELLGDPDVAVLAVHGRAGTVAKHMKPHVTLEARALLPLPKSLAELARGEAPLSAAQEQGRVGRNALAFALLPDPEAFELRAQGVGQQDLLGVGAGVASLENPELNPSAGLAVGGVDVADVQPEQLVLAQPAPEGEGDQDVVAEGIAVLAGRLQEQPLFVLKT